MGKMKTTMMFADDVLVGESLEEVNDGLKDWKTVLEGTYDRYK